ncbi:hypothetical protein O6H91_03G099900 [Diphasiastrum complanatum]|uniref:Uncharacterized protein n=3 Tax=Diphasiastrum complanatum TaxID=34168 RepID=A0ACC2E9L4_DIPCM|nr:hypothetical protein O6H91_03G099900 [Diphasiastrum complanatum]
MAAKSGSLFQGKKGNKKGIGGGMEAAKGAGGSIAQGVLSVRKTSDGDGKHAYMVELRLGSVDSASLRCKKFNCDHRGSFDDMGACARAFRFAMSTDELAVFRAFVLEEGSSSGCGSSTDSEVCEESVSCVRNMDSGFEPKDAGVGEQFLVRQHQGKIESLEACERKPVSYLCIRENTRAGLRFAVAMTQIENGQRRMISFLLRQSYGVNEDETMNGDEKLLNRAIVFLRSTSFEHWRKNGANKSFPQGDQSGTLRRERALKHPFSYIGIEDGEKVDCSCGKNRSKGLMVACEQCGAWEHAECLGYRFNSQIPADYICSACIRAQKEEVVFIRLDEQGGSQIQYSYDLLGDLKERGGRHGNEAVCCVCGCEDNEDLETMMHPCSCGGGLASAHPNCVLSALESAKVKEQAKQAGSSSLCPLCGGQGFVLWGNNSVLASSESAKEISPPKPKRNSRRSNSENSLKGLKRLRSALAQPGVEKKSELAENILLSGGKHEAEIQTIHSGKKINSVVSESIKPEVTVLGRRFADATVTVPIKKRRIQLMEAVRSPSPPPRSPSPSPQSNDLIVKDDKGKGTVGNLDDELQSMQDTEMAESGFVEHVEIMSSKNLEAEPKGLTTGLTSGKEQSSHEEDEKGKSSSSKSEENALPVAQVNCMKEEIDEIEKIEVCKDVIKVTGANEKVGLSSSWEQRSDLQDPRISTAASNILEVPKNVCEQTEICEISQNVCKQKEIPEVPQTQKETPSSKPNIEVGSQCLMAEEGANDQELCKDIKKDLSLNHLERADKVQEGCDGTGSCSEPSLVSKDEQQLSSKQSLDESSSANIPVHNRDDRSHWDLNMEMEAWERPPPEFSTADASLANVTSPKVASDCHEDGEVMASPENQDFTDGDITEDNNANPKDTDGSSDHAPSLMILNTARVDSDLLLEFGNVMATARQVLSSEVAAVTDKTKDVEACIGGEMHVNFKDQAQESAGLPTDSVVNASEYVLQPSPSAANLVSTVRPEGIVDSNTMMSVLLDARKHTNNPDAADLGFESDSLDHTRDIKEGVVGSDAFEEDEHDVDSPRSLQDMCEGQDNEGALNKKRSSDSDEGVQEDLEGEDVDYGDSENEDEPGHADGDAYDLEADELASGGSQEREFEDEQIDVHEEAHGNTDEEGPNLEWVDLGDGDDRKLDADMVISHSDEDGRLQINPAKENQDENAGVRDTQSCYETLAKNAENVNTDEESGKLDNEISFDALPFSKKTSTVVRAKSSGWDQLPEGFEKAEDALRAVKESSVRGGRGASRGTFVSVAGRGTPSRMDAGLGERSRAEVSAGQSRADHRYDQRMDDNSSQRFASSREFGRGRSRGRGRSSIVPRGRSRVDPWVNGAGGPPGQWAPKRHPSPPGRFGENPGFGQRRPHTNAAAAAAAKLESSGFVVAPDGTITKAAGNNPLRGAPRPFPGGGRSSGGAMFNSGRGAVGMNEMNLGSRVGLSPGRGFGFGPSMRGNMGPGMGLNMGANPGIRVGGRGMIERYRFPPRNPVGEHSLSRPVLEHSEKWNRRERHLSPASLKLSRSSPPPRSHKRSRSKSRTRSPHLRTPPRSGNNSVLRRSRSPLHVRSVVKGESRESSPLGHRSIPPPPKLPLPPPPPRGQRSPPAGLKRLSDRRDGDRKYTDLEQTRSIVESHTSPRRLSSHIEQNAASFDEANQQPIGKTNSEVRRPSGDELGDDTTHAARKDETLLKGRRLKDEGERDRRMDDGFHRRTLGREDSRREFVKSRRDGRTGNNSRHASSRERDDDVAPRRRRAPS